jgi:hypothetical protein
MRSTYFFYRATRLIILVFVLSITISVPYAAQQAGPALSVDLTAPQHPISPYIYGMNWVSEALAEDIDLPVQRWGGNAVTRYNWQNDTTNRASDWYFENIPNENPAPENLPDGSSSDRFHEQNQRTGTDSFMVVPTIGWVAKARQFDCGFRVSKYGAQQQTDPWQPDCGNGLTPGGDEIVGNDPLDTSIAVDETFVQAWMQHLIGKYGDANSGGVRFYNLDNEPFIWNETHRDVYPEPLSYDGSRDMTYTYAAAIKATDPNALILGPGDWGWTAYFYSALDWEPGGDWWNNPLDRLAHGDIPFIEWYLQQMKLYEDQHGVRLIDYVDEHFYPQNGVSLNSNVDPATAALRLRSTRALWDPSYVDESWINEPVRLIPRMHEWVENNYPGTKIAIGEYNWGALDHINGALAQADVLGIFGRERVDLAALWTAPEADDPAAFAFRMYRNYDGSKSKFGDMSVQSTSADQEKLAIYGARRTSDGALTLMIINKTGDDLTSSVDLNGFTPAPAASVYRYSEENLAAIEQMNAISVTVDGFSATFPANSITLVVLSVDAGASTELLSNGDFETAGSSGGEAVNWTAKNLIKDKRKCNKDGKPPVAFAGNCAFMFTGTAGVKSSIEQMVNVSSINSGDTLILSAQVNTKNISSGGKIIAKMTYADSSKDKAKISIPPGTSPYAPLSQFKQAGTAEMTGLKVSVSMKPGSGKFFVDNVSLLLNTPASTAPIPLPMP